MLLFWERNSDCLEYIATKPNNDLQAYSDQPTRRQNQAQRLTIAIETVLELSDCTKLRDGTLGGLLGYPHSSWRRILQPHVP